MSGSIAAAFPLPSVPFVGPDGRLTVAALNFLQVLWTRTGGGTGAVGVPGGTLGEVQANGGSGTFQGLTSAQLTGKLDVFTSSLQGAVPASGGVPGTFLEATGNFVDPTAEGPAGGDLTGTYPDPTVSQINGVALGSTTATSGNLLIGSGAAWVTHAVSGDATINSTGTVAVSKVNGGAIPASAAVLASNVSNQVISATTSGTGATAVLATNPTLAGVTVDGDGLLHLTSQTTDAAAQLATMTNAPTSGNPTFWLRVSINGTPLAMPAWPA